ncbi:hypothetical protein KR054_007294 [Drosophila jambulina]|nr:hypothetical protein KR054_007294 [Drosophila jambulina]
MDPKVTLVVVLATISLICAKDTTYELVFSDEGLFTACSDPAPGTLDIHGYVDSSEFSTTLEADGLLMSGNITNIWDIQPQDRVQVTKNSKGSALTRFNLLRIYMFQSVIKLFYFDRGTWTPTFYSVTSNDFCKEFYDPKLPWHKYWFRHLTNLEDVKDKCVAPGVGTIKTYKNNDYNYLEIFLNLLPQTKHIFETFLLSATMTMPIAKLREGLYKIQLTFQAFDENGIERPTRICSEILGNLQKVSNV